MDDVHHDRTTTIPDMHEVATMTCFHNDDALLALLHMLQQSGYHFTTPTPATHARVNQRPGNERAQSLIDVFGWSRVFTPDLLPREMLHSLEAADAIVQDGAYLRSRLRVSTIGKECYLHSAFPTTSADSVFFGPDTYRYRRALDTALKQRATTPARMIDIGCGAGPGAIGAALHYPLAEVWATDINPLALQLTRINARAAGLKNIKICHSNLLNDIDGEFDFIMSNPPYLLDSTQRTYRHGGGELGDGLSRDIVRTGCQRLRPDGELLLYTGSVIVDGKDALLASLPQLFDALHVYWSYTEIDPDVFGEELDEAAYAHADRIAVTLFHATRRQ